ncbi:ABC transporter permease [Actinocorallia sp. API 0066]|uniref:ABC transporter permease n=1 Tax=Actinocorallia sp. API 0066 TaxID=2896846 RepID=UPI001E2CCAC0|nr:ABC transporter permease subunit [Actinocorallia sp. API 0066]MCD0447643.1 ABC transporter permease [Actinocorallia sp. API 0066]
MAGVRGIGLVARQELRTRVRARRWRLLLGVWFGLVGLLTFALWAAYDGGYSDRDLGVAVYGTLLLLVLLLVLLLAPALASQSVNGERERGTLALLQLTGLTPGEIAAGKLVAAWGTGLVALGLTLPFLAWPVLTGAVRPVTALVSVLVTALLMGVVCALALCFSAVAARGVASALASYLTVFGMLIGTVICYGVYFGLTAPSEGSGASEDESRGWWLLAPHPFVVLADAAPETPPRPVCGYTTLPPTPEHPQGERVRICPEEEPAFDLLGELRETIRELRAEDVDYVVSDTDHGTHRYTYQENASGPVWPYGLAVNLALGAGAFAITVKRLRLPVKHLAEGTRLA